MDDLDELARANEARRVQVYRKPPPLVVYSPSGSSPRGYSPFRWGLGLLLGAGVGGIVAFIALGGGVWMLSLLGQRRLQSSFADGAVPTAAAQVGPATLSVKEVVLTRPEVPQIGGGGAGGASDVQISVVLGVTNDSTSTKFVCALPNRSDVSLKDNFGNTYRLLDTGSDGAGGGQSVYPGQTVQTTLMFERPVAAAEYLDLEITGINRDDPARFLLRIPTASIKDPGKLDSAHQLVAQAEALRAAAAAAKAEAYAASRHHGTYGNTSLHDAARDGDAQRALNLLNDGAEIDATQNNGLTALHFAAWNGHGDVATVLLDHGAAINATTLDGRTPLDYAIEYKRDEVAALLRSRGALSRRY